MVNGKLGNPREWAHIIYTRGSGSLKQRVILIKGLFQILYGALVDIKRHLKQLHLNYSNKFDMRLKKWETKLLKIRSAKWETKLLKIRSE